MPKAKSYPIAIPPEGQFYGGGDPAEAEGEADMPAAKPRPARDKGGKERALAYVDVFDMHQNVEGVWWKCANCEKKIKKAAPGGLYDEIKSHLLCAHDNEPASKSETRTIAEVCFPVSVIIHREKGEKKVADRLKRATEPRTNVLEHKARAPMLETRPTALTVSEAIDALVAAGFTATKTEIAFLTTEAKKRIRVAAHAEDVDAIADKTEDTDGAGSSGDAAVVLAPKQDLRRRRGQQPQFGSS
jgi:hypothetical protein